MSERGKLRMGKAFLARLRVRAESERGPFARASAWVRLSEAHAELGSSEEALECAQRAALESSDSLTSMQLAQVLSTTWREDEALPLLSALLNEPNREVALRAAVLRAEILARRGDLEEGARARRELLGVIPGAFELDAAIAEPSALPPPIGEGPPDASERLRWRRAWREARPNDLQCTEECAAIYASHGDIDAALSLWADVARRSAVPELGVGRGTELAARAKRSSDVVAWYVLCEVAARTSEAMPKLVRSLRDAGLGDLEEWALMRDVDTGARGDLLSFRRALASLHERNDDAFAAGAELWRANALLDEHERALALQSVGFAPINEAVADERGQLVERLQEALDGEAVEIAALLESLLGHADLHAAYARLTLQYWRRAPADELLVHALRASVLLEDLNTEDEVLRLLREREPDGRWDSWYVRSAWRVGKWDVALERARASMESAEAPLLYWIRVLRAAELAQSASLEGAAWERVAERCGVMAQGPCLARAARACGAAQQRQDALRLCTEVLTRSDSLLARLEVLELGLGGEIELGDARALAAVVADAKPRTECWLRAAYALASAGEGARAAELMRRLSVDRYWSADSLRAAVNLLVPHADARTLRDLFAVISAPGRAPRDETTSLALGVLPTFFERDRRAAEGAAHRWLSDTGVVASDAFHALMMLAEKFDSDALASDVLHCQWQRLPMQPEEKRKLLTALATRYAAMGDTDAEARCVAFAMAQGRPAPQELQTWAVQLLDPASRVGADSRLAVATALADGTEGADGGTVVSRWRQLGYLRWELADDRDGALAAWMHAARLAGDADGFAELSRHAVQTFGPTEAFDGLLKLAEGLGAEPENGPLRLEVAQLALESLGRGEFAFRIAREFVTHASLGPRALDICERSGASSLALSEVYDSMAAAASGQHAARRIYGRASLHFERSGQPTLAFEHALRALSADVRSPAAAARVCLTVGGAAEPERAAVALEKAAARVKDAAQRVELRVVAAVVLAGCEGQCARAMTRLVDAFLTTSDLAFLLGLQRIVAPMVSLNRAQRDSSARELERALDHMSALEPMPSHAAPALVVAQCAAVLGAAPTAMRGAALALLRDPLEHGYDALRAHLPMLSQSPGALALVGKMAGEVLSWPQVSLEALEFLDGLASCLDARVAHARFALRRAEVSGHPSDRTAALEAARGVPDLSLQDRLSALEAASLQPLEQRDHARYARMLGERISTESDLDARILLRMRRAAVLVDRLGLESEAVAELEAALQEQPQHVAAREFLASIRCESGS